MLQLKVYTSACSGKGRLYHDCSCSVGAAVLDGCSCLLASFSQTCIGQWPTPCLLLTLRKHSILLDCTAALDTGLHDSRSATITHLAPFLQVGSTCPCSFQGSNTVLSETAAVLLIASKLRAVSFRFSDHRP